MRFLLDENTDLRLRPYLRSLGHDVTAIVTDYQACLTDREVLALAVREGRVIITNDRDFGDLVIREQLPHAGVIYLRLRTTAFAAIRDRLTKVLQEYAGRLDRFLVVTERTVRVR